MKGKLSIDRVPPGFTHQAHSFSSESTVSIPFVFILVTDAGSIDYQPAFLLVSLTSFFISFRKAWPLYREWGYPE